MLPGVSASKMLNWGFVWRYELSTLIIFLSGAFIGSILFRLSTRESGIFGLASAYPNYGYMGVPLAIMIFGAEATIPMAVILIADTLILLALVAVFSTASRASRHINISDYQDNDE